ncbi:hypothetical protein GUJ93_ZPchr0009g1764 [Zizania palustris]|uniref:Uncharacterized protein n=1 Tax=Zizania palustris TaxID=103762 RepID=A0A8J5UZ87_ZIZPA|nr:hypothetical protein GUJ93_ZPchr0009g1764 [Zizania palustris]
MLRLLPVVSSCHCLLQIELQIAEIELPPPQAWPSGSVGATRLRAFAGLAGQDRLGVGPACTANTSFPPATAAAPFLPYLHGFVVLPREEEIVGGKMRAQRIDFAGEERVWRIGGRRRR